MLPAIGAVPYAPPDPASVMMASALPPSYTPAIPAGSMNKSPPASAVGIAPATILNPAVVALGETTCLAPAVYRLVFAVETHGAGRLTDGEPVKSLLPV